MMKIKKTPQRRCVGCNTMFDKKALVRIVRASDGSVALDKTGKKPGRGAYVCSSEECITKAVKEKRLEKALDTSINDDVYSKLLEGLEHE
ncbi:MAG TPA: YlxR family protein [Candidatus Avacidaminococcus intestinavium]|uniref:YlxR family protein n=1 Tax=Candidatus Avacidaminococcus intestinavium TaxID=2840684 RepID=A0A9D1MQQ7_9FIRM|nr:YlxR family protein [Candidatus Avacidaminococcus intestinavium]